MFCDGKTPVVDDIFSCTHLFFRFLIGTILYTLIVIAEFILLIIPGLFWAVKFWYFDYFIVDKEMKSIRALKASAAITESAKGDLFIFLCLLFLINVLGTLLLFVGLFATINTTIVALAYVYRKLRSRFESSGESEEPVTTAQ